MKKSLPRSEWLQRFSVTLSLLRGGAVAPMSMLESWLDGNRSPLEHWVASNPSVPWFGGDCVLKAAQLLVGGDVAAHPAPVAPEPARVGSEQMLQESAEVGHAIRSITCSPVALAAAMAIVVRGVDWRRCSKTLIAETVENMSMSHYVERRSGRDDRVVYRPRRLLEALLHVVPEVEKHQSARNRLPLFPSQEHFLQLCRQADLIMAGRSPA